MVKNLYKIKLIFRIVVVSSWFIIVFLYRGEFLNSKFLNVAIYSIWLVLVLELFIELFPFYNKHLSSGKMLHKNYKMYNAKENDIIKKVSIKKRKSNAKARVIVALTWIIMLVVIGVLKHFGVINSWFIISLVAFFYLADTVCINVFCPFRKFIVKNKCCVDCPIFNWGQPMNFIPLIFIVHPLSYSLVFLSLIILVQWEFLYYKHPERFNEYTNQSLKCSSCKDKYLYQNCNYKKYNKECNNER